MVEKQSTLLDTKKIKGERRPRQERSQKRMELVVETTELMLLDISIENISIPEIAIMSGVPRTSIYQFFPSKYDLLHHIALIHLNKLVARFVQVGMEVMLEHNQQDLSVISLGRILVAKMIQTSAEFYNQSPVASILILGGPFTRKAYLTYLNEIKKISLVIRQALKVLNIDVYLPKQPDALTMIIELIFTCMKHGYHDENYISEVVCNEAYRMTMAYLVALNESKFEMSNITYLNTNNPEDRQNQA